MAKDMAYSVKRQQVLGIFVWSLKNFPQETVILWYTFLSAHVVSKGLLGQTLVLAAALHPPLLPPHRH
jgi:hypothetical protein